MINFIRGEGPKGSRLRAPSRPCPCRQGRFEYGQERDQRDPHPHRSLPLSMLPDTARLGLFVGITVNYLS